MSHSLNQIFSRLNYLRTPFDPRSTKSWKPVLPPKTLAELKASSSNDNSNNTNTVKLSTHSGQSNGASSKEIKNLNSTFEGSYNSILANAITETIGEFNHRFQLEEDEKTKVKEVEAANGGGGESSGGSRIRLGSVSVLGKSRNTTVAPGTPKTRLATEAI
jgi:hypothetical protein